MKKIFTVIKWVKTGHSFFSGDTYSYKDVVMSFENRKMAYDHIRDVIGAKYIRGYYVKGDYLYTVKQTKFVG